MLNQTQLLKPWKVKNLSTTTFAMTCIEQNSHVHENPQFRMQTHILILQLLYFIRDHDIFQGDV